MDARCSNCGWTGTTAALLRSRCPNCRHLAQTEADDAGYYWMGTVVKFVAIVVLLGGAVWYFYPQGKLREMSVRIESINQTDSTAGAVARFRMINETFQGLGELKVLADVTFQPPGGKPRTRAIKPTLIEKLPSKGTVEFEVVIPDAKAKELVNWSPRIQAYKLLKSEGKPEANHEISIRVAGTKNGAPLPFPENPATIQSTSPTGVNGPKSGEASTKENPPKKEGKSTKDGKPADPDKKAVGKPIPKSVEPESIPQKDSAKPTATPPTTTESKPTE